ncbi:MAG: iron-sulfur cluster assembly scaffold protein [Candidatus Calescibacterium sp.]|nr:iron-sulfur cluster assembly scaffold protein [Candidatus Calescibacterium sp.]MCX7972048.1 iron-sulfur cluster assembly scaffold protein [bacterium]MDW8194668.1 iron-sulfur cluster assembly scaffold protein [Candidatus Calescibacterium sp.]
MDKIDQEKIEIFLEHYENSPYKYEMEKYDVAVEGGNPGCGDVVKIYLKVKEDKTVELSFEGSGCTISQASTSILLENLQGKKIEELEKIDLNFLLDLIGKDVYLLRPNCSTLGLNVLKAVLKKYYKINNQD